MTAADPYSILGVDRRASTIEIKAAQRRRVRDTHPDVGGDRAEFDAVQNAARLLLDSQRRAKYDATGDADQVGPDNHRAGALQIIDGFINRRITAYVSGGMSGTPADPRRGDLVAECREQINDEISNATLNMFGAQKALAFLEDFAKRWSTTDASTPIERMLEHKIRGQRQGIAAMREAIETRRVALTILATYKFRQDIDDPFVQIEFLIPAEEVGRWR